jgi:hypothetical protein
MHELKTPLGACAPSLATLALATLAGACALALAAPPARAQPVSSADVNIVSVTLAATPKTNTCTTVINNQNDDDAYRARVIVLLPLQTPKVLSATVAGGPGHCTLGPALGGFTEVVTCDLGQLPQGPTVHRTIKVVAEHSTAAPTYKPTCSAFIYSLVGDIDKTNNYKVAP